jgi:hypothetical protein
MDTNFIIQSSQGKRLKIPELQAQSLSDRFKDSLGFIGNKCTTKKFETDPETYRDICCIEKRRNKSVLRMKRCDYLDNPYGYETRLEKNITENTFYSELKDLWDNFEKKKKRLPEVFAEIYSLFIKPNFPDSLQGMLLSVLSEYNDYRINSNQNISEFQKKQIEAMQNELIQAMQNKKIKKVQNKFQGGHKLKTKTRKLKRGGRKWSAKYKKSINCRRPRGFSQKQYCKYGRRK